MTLDKLKGDFEIFRDHCIDIAQKHQDYIDLFDEENKDLLTKIASIFFTDISVIMHTDWILQVCKIMDKAEMFGDENITIKLINKQLQSLSKFNSNIENVSKELLKYGNKLKPARNKRLVHSDREHSILEVVLSETTEEELDEFLRNIQSYCDEVGTAIGIGSRCLLPTGCPGDVLAFLKYLKRAEEANASQ